VDINTQLTAEQRRGLLRLRDDPTWNQPRNVVVSEGEGVVSSVCVDGASYDLTLLDDRRAVHLRRSCDPSEIGSAASLIQAIVGAARGQDARFDAVFAEQPLARYAQSYAQLLEVGGRIRATSEDVPNAQPLPAPEFADEQEEAEQAILAADRAFAARSASGTAAQAFREFMHAEDGLVFRIGGEPVEGAEAIFRHFGADAPEEGKLRWEPVQAWAAASGDFGATWGRSSFIPNGAAAPVRAYRYLTVWRRDPDGKWKGLMDMGVAADDLLAGPPARPNPAPPTPSPGAR
jgi:ketosteroid isomerase-like protein